MAYIVVWGGTDNVTDANYCPTLADAKKLIEQELEDYGPEMAGALEVYEVGKFIPSTIVVSSEVRLGK
jgi:hypothetical protein